MVDLKLLENSLTNERIIELVQELGSDSYIEKDDCIIFKTICHNINAEDGSMKLYYYKKNKRFHCYTSCGDNFSIFELFRRRYELLGKAYSFYSDIVLKIMGNNDIQENFENFPNKYETPYSRYNRESPTVNYEHYNPEILNIFTFYPAPEWLADGITEQAMRYYQIRYSIEQNKIIIPHYDEHGNLIGIRGRALNPEEVEIGKYMPVQIENKLYSHPLGNNCYGLNFVAGNIKREKKVIIAEGEKSVLQYDSFFGHMNNICVAACGSKFHLFQFQQLKKLGVEEIIIAFDKEGENWQEQEKYFQKLKKMCEYYKNFCKISFLWDSKGLLKLKESPFDKGRDVFLELLNTKVNV